MNDMQDDISELDVLLAEVLLAMAFEEIGADETINNP